VRIPSKEMGFYLQFGPPAGKEMVKAIATVRPLNLKAMGVEGFNRLFAQVKITQRALFIRQMKRTLSQEAGRWSETVLTLRSHER